MTVMHATSRGCLLSFARTCPRPLSGTRAPWRWGRARVRSTRPSALSRCRARVACRQAFRSWNGKSSSCSRGALGLWTALRAGLRACVTILEVDHLGQQPTKRTARDCGFQDVAWRSSFESQLLCPPRRRSAAFVQSLGALAALLRSSLLAPLLLDCPPSLADLARSPALARALRATGA